MKRAFLWMVVPALLVALGFAQTPAASVKTDQTNSKGCLGGTDGHYTVVEDSTGHIFKITTSSVDLKPHLGHDVTVIGKRASGLDPAAADSGFAITEVNMISDHCAAAAAAPAAAPAATVSTPSEPASTPVAAAASAPTAAAAAPAASISTPAETAIKPAAPATAVSTTTETTVTPTAAATAPAATVSTTTQTAVTPAEPATAPAATVSATPETTATPAVTVTPPAATVSTPAETAVTPAEPVAHASRPPAHQQMEKTESFGEDRR